MIYLHCQGFGLLKYTPVYFLVVAENRGEA